MENYEQVACFFIICSRFAGSYQTVLADGTPPVSPTQAGPLSINSYLSGIPWDW
jgi:hypothetical protein